MPFLIPLATTALVGTAGVAGAAATPGLIGAGGAITTGGLISGGALIASTVGGIMSSQAASQQARDQKALANYNAKVEEQRAKQIELKASYDQVRQAKEAERIKSSLTAGLGSAGALGQSLLVQAKQASELDLENMMIGYEGQVGAGQARNQSKVDTIQAGIYGRKAKNTQTAGYINAGTSLLTGFNKAGLFSGQGSGLTDTGRATLLRY